MNRVDSPSNRFTFLNSRWKVAHSTERLILVYVCFIAFFNGTNSFSHLNLFTNLSSQPTNTNRSLSMLKSFCRFKFRVVTCFCCIAISVFRPRCVFEQHFFSESLQLFSTVYFLFWLIFIAQTLIHSGPLDSSFK